MMKSQKFWRFALAALLLSAFVFETMPGSVRHLGIHIPEAVYNFFTLTGEEPAAALLPLAGYATVVAAVLALVAAFSKKRPIFKAVGWCSLIAAALTAMPYVMQAENTYLQPNVLITILLTVCWLIAMMLDKKKDAQQTTEEGPRL